MKISVKLFCGTKKGDGDLKIKAMESEGWTLVSKPKKEYTLDSDGYMVPLMGKSFVMEKEFQGD